MMLTQGLTKLVSDITDDMTNGKAGTDTTLFDKSQSGVIAAIGSTDIALNDKTKSKDTINVTYILSTSLANSEAVAEYEVNNTSIAYNRILKSTIIKTSDIEINILHTFEFSIAVT